eukprot:6173151-Pleurochrysis_carterae.AAC.2
MAMPERGLEALRPQHTQRRQSNTHSATQKQRTKTKKRTAEKPRPTRKKPPQAHIGGGVQRMGAEGPYGEQLGHTRENLERDGRVWRAMEIDWLWYAIKEEAEVIAIFYQKSTPSTLILARVLGVLLFATSCNKNASHPVNHAPQIAFPHSQQNDRTVTKGRNGNLRAISRSAHHDEKVSHKQ